MTDDHDRWGIAANMHLLAYLRNHCVPGQSPTLKGMRASTAPNADASPDFVTNVKLLVEAKNSWAIDMRDIAIDDGVPPEMQKKIWRDYIEMAEQKMIRST